MPATLVTGGSYLFEISSGYDSSAFYLDDSLLNGAKVLDGDGLDYNDLTTLCTNVHIKRGREQLRDSFGAGTMTVSMRTLLADRSLDPLNTASTYYNSQTEQPGLAPLRGIRISRNGAYMFVGKITAFNQSYSIGSVTQYAVAAADDIYTLAQSFLPSTATAAQTSAARVSAVLALVPYTGSTSITASPTATLGAFTIAEGTNANAYINRVNDAEQGRIFVSRAGVLTMQPRVGTTLDAPTVTFDDVGVTTKYQNLVTEFDQQQVVNKAMVTIETGGTIQTASDSSSISEYFTQAISITDSLLSTDGQAATLANYLLDPIPLPRFTKISVYFGAITDAQKTALTALDIGNTVRLTRTFTTGAPTSITQTLSVEGIEHSIDVADGHTMDIYTAATTLLTQLVLDDMTYGIINSTNALG